jgi:hypothetical protein
MSAIQAGDVPTLNQDTTGTAAKATNIAGGTANEIPYQTAANTTNFISAAASSVLVTDASDVPSLSTTLPAVNSAATLVTDPTTSSSNNLNSTLSNIFHYNISSVNIRVFYTSGTYTPTAGMKYCIVELLGAGGGGAGALGGAYCIGSGGGGSGGYSKKAISAATVGISQTITVGAGGAGGAAGQHAGIDGGTTSFGSIFSANGGGGAPYSGPSWQYPIYNAAGIGGSATGGDFNMRGENGYYGASTGNTPDMEALGGAGANSVYGAGGIYSINAAGSNAYADGYGSGGGGAGATTTDLAGGNGGDGIIIITEFIS